MRSGLSTYRAYIPPNDLLGDFEDACLPNVEDVRDILMFIMVNIGHESVLLLVLVERATALPLHAHVSCTCENLAAQVAPSDVYLPYYNQQPVRLANKVVA